MCVRTKCKLVILGAALVFAHSAAAESPTPEIFLPPAGCTGFLTVQSRGCEVAVYYRCEGFPPGDYWRAQFGSEGLVFVSRTNAEGAWIELVDPIFKTRQTISRDSPEPPSFSTLISNGVDQFIYHMLDDFGKRNRLFGFDRLTGRRVTIDGISLQETEFEFNQTSEDGTPIERGLGQQFIVPEWRMFFSGVEYWGVENDLELKDNTPEEFIFPGEPGFFATRPKFECDAVTSDLFDLMLTGARHVAS